MVKGVRWGERDRGLEVKVERKGVKRSIDQSSREKHKVFKGRE